MFRTEDFIDKDAAEKIDCILDNIGIDAHTVIRMTLKKILREQSLDFLISGSVNAAPSESSISKASASDTRQGGGVKMTKNRAIALFMQEGISFTKSTTFSSKNTSTHIYWSNPNFRILENDWSLILNDWINRELHLFIIPKNSISKNALKPRADAGHIIDLQIIPNDPTFTDNRSKVSFLKYLAKSLKY